MVNLSRPVWLWVMVVVLVILVSGIVWQLVNIYVSYDENGCCNQSSVDNQEFNESNEQVIADTSKFIVAFSDEFNFISDNQIVNLSDQFLARNDKNDRILYYTLLANPEIQYNEAVLLPPPATLPTVETVMNDDGSRAFDIIVPDGAGYDIAVTEPLLSLSDVTFDGASIEELSLSFSGRNHLSDVLQLIQHDVKKLSADIDNSYSKYDRSPFERVHDVQLEGTMAGYSFPPFELTLLFTYEMFFGNYVHNRYFDNSIDEFITSNIKHLRFTYSDVLAAREVANTYMQEVENSVLFQSMINDATN